MSKEILFSIIKEKYQNMPFFLGTNKALEEIYKLELILENIEYMEQNYIPLLKAIEAKENKIEDVAHEIVNDTASEPIVFFSDEPIQLVDLKNESAIKQNAGF